jgi:hypothetical protein
MSSEEKLKALTFRGSSTLGLSSDGGASYGFERRLRELIEEIGLIRFCLPRLLNGFRLRNGLVGLGDVIIELSGDFRNMVEITVGALIPGLIDGQLQAAESDFIGVH